MDVVNLDFGFGDYSFKAGIVTSGYSDSTATEIPVLRLCALEGADEMKTGDNPEDFGAKYIDLLQISFHNKESLEVLQKAVDLVRTLFEEQKKED